MQTVRLKPNLASALFSLYDKLAKPPELESLEMTFDLPRVLIKEEDVQMVVLMDEFQNVYFLGLPIADGLRKCILNSKRVNYIIAGSEMGIMKEILESNSVPLFGHFWQKLFEKIKFLSFITARFYMNYSKTEEKLLDLMANIEVIDAHEHLPPESVRTSSKVDVFTLFAHYTRTDFVTAGMKSEDYDKMINSEEPLDERWQILKPFLQFIRYGSYVRPAFIALKEFYGFDEITDENYREISEKMMSENTPGIYKRILCDKCNIKVALTQAGRTDYDLDLLVPLMPLDNYARIGKAEEVHKRAGNLEMNVSELDDYIALARKGVEKWKEEGAVGLKMASHPNNPPDRKAAEKAFKGVMSGDSSVNLDALHDFLTNEMLEIAAEMDIVVAVHSGMWGDFRVLDAKHMIPVFPRHPRTRFDLYHLSMPDVRDAIVIGKNNPNVWLNLCWCHIISQEMTCSALDELIDLVPINKILAFGGDYSRPVEKVYGHLLMAKEDIARILGRRIDRGIIDMDDAKFIIQRWFWDNPKELYKLSL